MHATCACAQGVLRMGQEVEVRPGIITKDAEGRVKCLPIYSRIVSLFAEQNELQFAVPGGLIGVGLTVSERASAWAATQHSSAWPAKPGHAVLSAGRR